MKKNIAYYLRRYRFKSVYTRLIIVFSIVLSGAVLIVGGFSYIMASQSIKERVNEANLQTLYQMQQGIDAALEKVDVITSNIAMHYLMQKDYDSLSLYEKLDLPNAVSSQLTERYIDSIYVYYHQSGKVLSAPGGAVDISVLPDTEWFKVYESTVPLGFKPLIINRRTIDKGGVKIDAMTIIREFPLSSVPKIGTTVINIDRTKLFRTIQQNIHPTQNLFVLDASGELLSGDGNSFANLRRQADFSNIIKGDSGYDQIDVDGKPKMVSRIRSHRNGWMYIKVEDVGYLTAATKGIKSLTLWLILVCLGGGMTVWAIASLNFYKPILKLLSRIGGSGGDEPVADNEYGALDKAVNYIIVQKNNIAALYNRSREEIKNGLLLSFCDGYIDDMDHICEQLDAIGFPYQGCGFAVAMIKIDDYGEWMHGRDINSVTVMKAAVKDVIETVSAPDVCVIASNMGNDRIVALMSFRGDESATMKAVQAMQQSLKDRMGITATIGIGNACEGIGDIHRSYREALDALNYKVFTGNGSLIHINSFSTGGEVPRYYYPMNKEIELVNAVKIGDRGTALNIVSEVYEGMPKSAGIALYIPEMLWQLMNGVFRGMITMSMSYEEVFGESFFEAYQHYRSIEDIEGMRIFIEERINVLIDYVDKKRNSRNNAIIEAVKTHIEKHYAEDLCLNGIASKVYMSPSYVSTLFKEITGESFTDYVIGVRMSKAKEFLITEDKDINVIAGMAGYDNIRSFLRAFKRYTGMTPTEYRKLHAINKLSSDING